MKTGDYAGGCVIGALSCLWFLLRLIFSIVIVGLPLLLLAEWCFPDYVHIINEEISVRLVDNLAEEQEFDKLIWLVEEKEATIKNMSPEDQIRIRANELEARMSVGDFKGAERCMHLQDSLWGSLPEEQARGAQFPSDMQKARLYDKMGKYEEEARLSKKYFDHPETQLKRLEALFLESDDHSQYARQIASSIVDQFRLIYLQALLRQDFGKNIDLIHNEIQSSIQEQDTCFSLSLTANVASRAIEVDSLSEAQQCYTVLKQWIGENEELLDQLLPNFLATMLDLGVYLDDMESMYPIVDVLSRAIKNNYNASETDYYRIESSLLPYYSKTGRLREATKMMKRQSETFTAMLSRNFVFYGEEQRENLYHLYKTVIERSFAVLADHPGGELGEICYGNALFLKGLLLRSSEQIAKGIGAPGDNAAGMNTLRNYKNARRELYAARAMGGLRNKYRAWQLENDLSRMEDSLLNMSQDYRLASLQKTLSYADVRKQLGDDEAAIEFVTTADGRNLALIGASDMKRPKVIVMPTQEEIGQMIDSRSVYSSPDAGGAVWQRLKEHLEGKTTVYYAPSGELNRLAFNCVRTADGYVFDDCDMRLVSSTIDLGGGSGGSVSSALLVGDIRYSAAGSPAAADSSRQTVRSGLRHTFITALDGREVYDIDELFRRHNVTHSMLTRLYASEPNVGAFPTDRAAILHISTHGYYDPAGDTADNLSCSGLFLAGANGKWYFKDTIDTREDGIWTAYEISTCNFSKCQLAVLSACETGLGNIDNYEGVFGLQRGFKLAGVKSLLMSLWKVDDDATTAFMLTFYTEWIKSGNMNGAYREAVKSTRDDYPDPFYWGAFVLLDSSGSKIVK